jgi:hypothetical protein
MEPKLSPSKQPSYIPGGAAMTKQNSTIRTMTPYCVYENELKHISMMNALVTIFSSVGSFLLSTCISLWIAVKTLELTISGDQLLKIGVPVAGLLSAVSFFVAALAWWAKRSEWKTIQNSTRIIEGG